MSSSPSFLASRLVDLPVYPVEPPRPPAPEDHWAVVPGPRDDPAISPESTFVPRPYIKIQDIRDPADVRDALSPRPLAYLTGLRCVSTPSCTAKDHAVLEILLAAAYETDPTMRQGSFTVPVVSVLTLLGLSRRRLRDLVASLDRLADRPFELPMWTPTRRYRRRMMSSLPKAPQVPERWEALRDRMLRLGASEDAWDVWSDAVWVFYEESLYARDEVHPGVYAKTSIDGQMEQDYADPEATAFRMAILETAEAAFGIWYAPKERPLADPPVPPRLRRPDPSPEIAAIPLDRFLQEAATDEAGRPVMRFTPLLRHTIATGPEGEVLHFELMPILARYLDRSRQERGAFTRYAYINLSTLAGFSSRHSAGVYRRVCAESLESVTYLDSRTSRRAFNTKKSSRGMPLSSRLQTRYGAWSNALDLDDLAATAGYTFAKGGRTAQLQRNVLDPVNRDLATISLDDHRTRIEIDADGRARLDVVSMPPLRMQRRMNSRLLKADAFLKAGKAPTKRQLSDAILEAARQMSILNPDDDPRYRIRPSTWLTLGHRISAETMDTILPYVQAWQLALDEALSAGQPHYGDLTGAIGDLRDPSSTSRRAFLAAFGEDAAALWLDLEPEAKPRLRGERLLEAIRIYGRDRAALALCIEEHERPELTTSWLRLAVQDDGTIKAAEAARQHRSAVLELGYDYPAPTRHRRVRDGLLEKVRADRANDCRPWTEQLVERAIANRAERRQESQRRACARRRKARAEARAAREQAKAAQSSTASTV